MTSNLFYAVDTETTGLNTATDRPVQICLLQSNEYRETNIVINQLVNPCMPIPPVVTDIHGIKDADVYFSTPYTYAISHFWTILRQHMAYEPGPLCAHNIMYDLEILNHLGQPSLTKDGDYSSLISFPIIDTYQLAKRMFPLLKPKNLHAVYRVVTGEAAMEFHQAVIDCLMVTKIVLKMADMLGVTVKVLADYCSQPVPYYTLPFGKRQGTKADAGIVGYLRSISNNSRTPDWDVEETIKCIGNMQHSKNYKVMEFSELPTTYNTYQKIKIPIDMVQEFSQKGVVV